MRIVSRIHNRMRLRCDGVKSPAIAAQWDQIIRQWPGVQSVQITPQTGSVLVFHDPACLDSLTLEQQIRALMPVGASVAVPAPVLPLAPGQQPPNMRPSSLTLPRLPAIPVPNMKDANRLAKVGLLVSMAVTLLSLAYSKKTHAMAGAAHVAFLGIHLLHHRKRMLK